METAVEVAEEAVAEVEEVLPIANQATQRRLLKIISSMLDQASRQRIMKSRLSLLSTTSRRHSNVEMTSQKHRERWSWQTQMSGNRHSGAVQMPIFQRERKKTNSMRWNTKQNWTSL